MRYKAFVSSTFEDLERHRRYVIAALRKAGFFVDPMEIGAPRQVSQRRSRRSASPDATSVCCLSGSVAGTFHRAKC